MVRYENHCCECAVPGYPCMGSSCPNVNVPVYYCDICNDDTHAMCDIEGEHYCEKHAKDYLRHIFESLTVEEKAEVLDVLMESLED